MDNGHTPTPWIVAGDDEMFDVPFIAIETDQPTGPLCRGICEVSATLDDATGEFVLDEEARANAAFIVRAVNAHDDLIAALELVRMSAGWGVLSYETRAIVAAALAKASSTTEGEGA